MALTYAPSFQPDGAAAFVYADRGAGVTDWQELLKSKGASASVPGSDIARECEDRLAPRQINVQGVVKGASVDAYEAAKHALRAAHRPGWGLLHRYQERYIRARPVDPPAIAETPDALCWATWSAVFECADPYWYATTAITDTWAGPTSGATRVLPAVGGDIPTDPLITVTINTASGTGHQLTLALPAATVPVAITLRSTAGLQAGDVIAIDCLKRTIRLTRAATTTNAMGLLYTGAFFPLGLMADTLQVTWSGTMTLASIAVSCNARYL